MIVLGKGALTRTNRATNCPAQYGIQETGPRVQPAVPREDSVLKVLEDSAITNMQSSHVFIRRVLVIKQT